MATLLESLRIKKESGPLRSFDPLRDMRAVADLVELCFADTIDQDGKSFLQRMRSADNNPAFLRWAAAAAEWASAPLSGYVWQEGDRLVGNISLIPHYRHGRRFYLIANVAVHPDYRRRSIGRLLTERAIEHARHRNAPTVWLHVREENDAAVSLYQSLGFVERARRTTWYSREKSFESEVPRGVTFSIPRAHDWSGQRLWLLQNYPPPLAWHMPVTLNNLRPGFWGEFHRFMNNAWVRQWAAWREGRLAGVVSWQSMAAHANALWLAAPGDADECLVQGLLLYARKRIDSNRPLMLDYPARQSVYGIREAGFYEHQTLIWMELELGDGG